MSDRKLGYAILCLFLVIFFAICAYCLRPLLSPPQTRVIAFEKVGNLRLDDQVRLKGISYGTVKKIDWTRKKVLVTVQSGRYLTFHMGYSITTLDAGLMGDRMIMIDNGPENGAAIPPADTLVGVFLPGVSEAVGYMWMLRDVVDSLRDLSIVLLKGDTRHQSLVSQTKIVIKTVDSLSKSVLKFTSLFESNVSSYLDSINTIVNQASFLTKAVAASAPEYLTMLEIQVAKAGRYVATVDSATDRLLAASNTLSNKDNILWRNNIEKLSRDLVTVQNTLTGIQKELLKFKTYLRLW